MEVIEALPRKYQTKSCDKSRVLRHAAITSGVPQGSTSGPHPFQLDVNDIMQICKHDDVAALADDTPLLFSCANVDDRVAQADTDLSCSGN